MKYTLLLILSLVLAPASLANAESKITDPLILAQTSGCPRAEVIGYYETRNFYVNICQGSNDYIFYRGVSKSDGGSINLAASQNGKGTWVARNGNVVYRVNYTELVVTQNGSVILRERVISPP